MSYGRKDYFWGVAPEKSVFGELQTPYNEDGSNSIASLGRASLLSGSVSAGYIFQVTGLQVNCGLPGLNLLELEVNSTVEFTTYFDTTFGISFPEGGTLVMEPGDGFNFFVTNNDSISVKFYGLLYGFMQQTIV